MNPSDVRNQVLRDHARLQGDLDRLEPLVRELASGRGAPGAVRTDTIALLARLHAHMRWEESHLLPALREADAWGEARAERLARDHREQRDLLDYVNERLHDETQPATLLARDVDHLIAMLRSDMREEEAELLDERVLRDDVVAVDVLTS